MPTDRPSPVFFSLISSSLCAAVVVCTDNLNAGVAVMKSAQDGA
jgi:hypothetical protein